MPPLCTRGLPSLCYRHHTAAHNPFFECPVTSLGHQQGDSRCERMHAGLARRAAPQPLVCTGTPAHPPAQRVQTAVPLGTCACPGPRPVRWALVRGPSVPGYDPQSLPPAPALWAPRLTGTDLSGASPRPHTPGPVAQRPRGSRAPLHCSEPSPPAAPWPGPDGDRKGDAVPSSEARGPACLPLSSAGLSLECPGDPRTGGPSRDFL